MICLVDSDLIKKLAICDLLDEAVAALEATPESVHVLPTARYVLLKPIKSPNRQKLESVSRCTTACSGFSSECKR